MLKEKQIVIDYVMDGEKVKEITLSNNFMFRAYEVWKNKKNENGEKLESIIKVILNEKNALLQLKNGVIYKEKRYVPLITSPSMQKKEEVGYKCEYLFIDEDEIEFKDVFEKVTSLDKINELKGKDLSIVKDISSRLALSLSSSYKIDYNPSFVILSEDSYMYIKDNYIAFNENYELQKIDTSNTKAFEHTLFDGFGLMNDRTAGKIAKSLNIDYRVDFAVIRLYGTATKGLCLRFNWNSYFDEIYVEDTPYFEKRKDGYYVKDMYGKFINISNVDLILNESMVKWAKYYNSMDEMLERYDEFNAYEDILKALYVTKINKAPEKIKKFKTTNYQLLSNLALTKENIEKLSEFTENEYQKILNYDLDTIKIFLGDLITDENEESSITSRVLYLIKKLGNDAFKIKEVNSIVFKSITKKIKDLASGKFYLEGSYNYICSCPISYCNWILNRKTSHNGLQEHEFYIPNKAGEKIVFSRNPIATYQEPQKTILSNKLDKYLKDYSQDLIFFNEKDDVAMLLSGSDKDGDAVTVFYNDILYNSVIEPEEIFINLADDKTIVPKHEFNRKNRLKDELACSGNLIGKIANTTAIINSLALCLNDYRNNKTGKIRTWKELRTSFCKSKNIEMTKENMDKVNEQFNEKLQKRIDNNEYTQICNLSEDEQKQCIIKNFYKYRIYSFYALQMSMLAIDAPKTLKFPSDDELARLDKFFRAKKPRFMCYADKCKKDNTRFYYSSLDYNSSKVAGTLLREDLEKKNGKYELEKRATAKDDKKIIYELLSKNIKSNDISKELECLYNNYKNNRNKYILDKKMDKDLKSKFLDKIDLQIITEFKEIKKNSDIDILANTLIEIKADTRFIFNICWDVLSEKIDEQYTEDIFSYIKVKNSDFDINRFKDVITFLGESYYKVRSEIISKVSEVQEIAILKRLRLERKVRIMINNNSLSINSGDIIEVIGDEIFISGNLVGTIFKEYSNTVNNGEYKIINIEIAKSKKSATIWI